MTVVDNEPGGVLRAQRMPGVSIGHMLRTPKYAVTRLGELLVDRMGRNSRLSLYEALVAEGRSFEPDAELVAHLIRYREELSSWMHTSLRREVPDDAEDSRAGQWEPNPETFLRDLLVPWLQEKNQFLYVDEEAARQLDAVYRHAIVETACVLSSHADEAQAAEELRRVWEAHRKRLASFARTHLGEHPHDAVCAAYSPSLQLRVLHLLPEEMTEPILDIGCGRDAALVRFLRERGIQAFGVDQVAPGELEGVADADWLDFDYGECIWGTVISHLGFSLHFLRHHLAEGPTASELSLEYARAYMRILRSLGVGGIFAYAPGLPFIEALLPSSEYPLERIGLPTELREAVTSLEAQERTNSNLQYVTRVQKLA